MCSLPKRGGFFKLGSAHGSTTDTLNPATHEFTAAYVAESPWNDTAWRTGKAADHFNELVVAARSELDTGKRRAMYYECQALLNDDGGSLIPMFANNIMALNKRVAHDEKIAGNWEMDGYKAIERWWFA